MTHPANAWKNHFAAIATALLAALAPALAQPTQQAYVKASNTRAGDYFGYAVAVSGDTMVVGACAEDSCSRGVNSDQTDNHCADAGAAYVYVRNGTNWVQEAYLKAANADAYDYFGLAVAISGNTVVVGTDREGSAASGINGDETDNSALGSGAAYVFVRDGTNWTQQAYLKPSFNISGGLNQGFGTSVGISGDTIVVGAKNEHSDARGVNGVDTNYNAVGSGAAYVFVRTGTNWTQQAYLKASNADSFDFFGISVAISGDTIIVGAANEGSNSTGVNGDQTINTGNYYGAAYIFARNGTNWSQQAYLKPSPGPGSEFSRSVAVSGDTVAVLSPYESRHFVGINSAQDNFGYQGAGTVYIFRRTGTNWTQEAHIKPALGPSYRYSVEVALSGNTLVIGKFGESSSAVGVNGNENLGGSSESGAAYVYVRRGTNWTRKAYLKSSNNNPGDQLGVGVAISGDTVVTGAFREDSAATGIEGNQTDDSRNDSGAAYVFTGFNHGPELTMTPDGTGGFFLRFNAIENLSYRLERSPNVNGPWTTNATLAAAVTGPIEFHDTNTPPGQAFYRVAQQ